MLFSHCVRLFAALWTAARQTSLSFTVSWSFLKLMSIELMMSFNHLILCHLLLFLTLIFPSMRVFSNEFFLLNRWPKYWSFSFCTFNEYSGLISFRIDGFGLLAAPGTLKGLIQHHNSKASILQCLAFFMVQLSHLYMTMEKTLSLTLWTFVCKVMSLLLNTLSRCVIAFIPRSKHLWRYKASICHIKG